MTLTTFTFNLSLNDFDGIFYFESPKTVNYSPEKTNDTTPSFFFENSHFRDFVKFKVVKIHLPQLKNAGMV
jgi:hypothetical protein